MTAPRVVATFTGPAAPIVLRLYAGTDRVAAVELSQRAALQLALDPLGLALAKLRTGLPAETTLTTERMKP